MKNHADRFPVDQMASLLKASKSGYYAFLKRPKSARDVENEVLLTHIRQIHRDTRETYGSPRIHAELKERGMICSRKRVARLMKASGIQSKMAKHFKCTTQKDPHNSFVGPDLVEQDFKAETPNEAWVSDITYIATPMGWIYCCVVLDLFSRKVVGLSIDEKMTADLVVNALMQALKHRGFPAGVVHHSDQGSQYTSKAMQVLAEEYGVQLSMGRVGNAYDNAVSESFFHTLKTELTPFEHYQNLEEAKMSIFRYVLGFYNNKRRHSTLGYLAPVAFEQRFENKTLAHF